ncbi:hypothetical protein [Iodobacter ciconiae]|uniref:Lipoprotein n=1 Tax=Iodobacter ciconiae TaxID=2496266 RepID=A0A3S8ZRX2_9NEIS|nr:hypothetical protein [Iodobacter ciconiae]AZN36204.1 hypothetical protein EJO50_06745 [Iodobacter ciconiae]
MYKFCLICVSGLILAGCAATKSKYPTIFMGSKKTDLNIEQFLYHTIVDGTDEEKTAAYLEKKFGKPTVIHQFTRFSRPSLVYDWRIAGCQIMVELDPKTKTIQEHKARKYIEPGLSYYNNCSLKVTVKSPERTVLVSTYPDYAGRLSIRSAYYGDHWVAWIGKKSDKLIKDWGVPTSTAKLDGGNTVFQYSSSSYDDFIGKTYNCTKKFLIKNGVIEKFSYSGCREKHEGYNSPYGTDVPGLNQPL